MNLFSLGLKSDKDLKKYLNCGNIEENPSQNSSSSQNNTDSEQTSKVDNLLDNNEKISIGIRDSNIPETYIEERKAAQEEDQKNLEEEEDKKEEKETSLRHDSMVLDNNRSLFLKIFGPMEAGSIRGSIFNMVILSLGTGMFALPRYMSNTSLFFSCIFD